MKPISRSAAGERRLGPEGVVLRPAEASHVFDQSSTRRRIIASEQGVTRHKGEDQQNEEDRQEHREKDLGDAGGAGRKTGEAERAGHQGDHEEDEGPLQHGKSRSPKVPRRASTRKAVRGQKTTACFQAVARSRTRMKVTFPSREWHYSSDARVLPNHDRMRRRVL